MVHINNSVLYLLPAHCKDDMVHVLTHRPYAVRRLPCFLLVLVVLLFLAFRNVSGIFLWLF